MAACLRFKVPIWNLKPGSRPTETSDGSFAMTDPWADNEGVKVECHGNSGGERGALSVERGARGETGNVEREAWSVEQCKGN